MTRKPSHQKSAQFFFALGHPRRLRIIDMLQEHPKGLTFESLEGRTSILGASLSHHLRFLKDAKIINRQVRDRFSIYRLDEDHLKWMMTTQARRVHLKAA